jgi:hypothetical protein
LTIPENFIVLGYNEPNLLIALENPFIKKDQVKIKKKKYFDYFWEYFRPIDEGGGLGAATIIIENDYISRSYMHDYADYYALCFQDYIRKCKRIHFFNIEFTQEQFITEILSTTSQFVSEGSYLGYIVVKPLPNTLIGASILKTYKKSEGNDRIYNTIKEYNINLCGRNLKIKSLAFQEQDKVVSACATSALWSAFHKTSELFQTKLPTPIEITNSAKNLFFETGRITPNEGLDYFQIGNAIEATDLVFELRNEKKLKDIKWLKSFIYAYNRCGLPVLLGIEFLEDHKDQRHLLTVTGYKAIEYNFGRKKKKMSTWAQKIERFYAHDDQVGPFSRLGFKRKLKLNDGIENAYDLKLETSWKKGNENLLADVVSIIVPLYEKIRLKYEDIYEYVLLMDLYFNKVPIIKEELVWDIYLEKSNKYKEQIRGFDMDNKNLKKKILVSPLPKYVWIARALLRENNLIFEFVFDSTDIVKGNIVKLINIYDEVLNNRINKDLKDEINLKYFRNEFSDEFCDLLIDSSNI